jgi:hypothetical protein
MIDLTTEEGFQELDKSLKALFDKQYAGAFHYIALAFNDNSSEYLNFYNADYELTAYLLRKMCDKQPNFANVITNLAKELESGTTGEALDKLAGHYYEICNKDEEGLIYCRSVGEDAHSTVSGTAERVEMMILAIAAQGKAFEDVILKAAYRIASKQKQESKPKKTHYLN